MSTNPTQLVSFEERGSITVGTVVSATMLDGMNVSEFGKQVLEYVKDKTSINLLLSFEPIEYMSSAALTELLRINERVRKGGGTVRLCSLTKDIRKVFQITNLEKLFVIHGEDGVQTAAKRFERAVSVAAEDDAWAAPDTAT